LHRGEACPESHAAVANPRSEYRVFEATGPTGAAHTSPEEKISASSRYSRI
jgi:hypothetical protein